MLHSGSRGVGNAIGTFFIELAKQDMRKWHINLPDEDLAYFPEGTDHFDDYVEAVGWAQDFAALNRRMMMTNVLAALRGQIAKPFDAELRSGELPSQLCDARKPLRRERAGHPQGGGARGEGRDGDHPGLDGREELHRARAGQPGELRQLSATARDAIMSRTEAKKLVTLDEHIADTAGVECRKDEGVIDETPKAYKPIEAVMAAQADLVEIVHTLKQVVCVKG